MKPPTPAKTRQAGVRLGEHVVVWRKLLGLTAEQLSERAGISRTALRRLETGETGIALETLLNVLRALGQLDRVVDALDPFETDLGRARADQRLPKRVRQ